MSEINTQLSSQRLHTRIRLKTDSVSNWQQSQLSLYLGEIAISYQLSDDALSTKYDFKVKIGDGKRVWSEIPYFLGDITPEGISNISAQLSSVFVNNEKAAQMISAEIKRQLPGDYVLTENFTTDNIQTGNSTWLLSCGNAKNAN